MNVSEILENKFENDLIDFLNKFQEENDCRIEFWTWTYDENNNYTLRVKVKKESNNMIN